GAGPAREAAAMPQFRYRAVTHAGEILTGEVEAPSRVEVVRRIEYLGHLTIEAEIASAGMLSGAGLLGDKQSGKQLKSRDVSMLLRQLALLLGAGLTLADALATLSDDANAAVAGFARGLRGAISSGESFAQALERHAAVIDPGYVAMVRAGEASGRL